MTSAAMPDAGVKGWIFNTARDNYWRVPSWYEFDDLVMDGYLCYAKCVKAYEHTPVDYGTKAEQLMAATRVAFMNHIFTLARKHSLKEIPASALIREGEPDVDVLEQIAPPEEESATILTVLANAPAELKELIQLLLNDATGFARKQVSRRKLRETTNEYWCRLMGLDPATNDLRAKVEEHFNF